MAGDGEWLFEEIDKNTKETSRSFIVNAGILILG